MTFNDVFKNKKPVIGMIHTGSSEKMPMLELAKKEIEIYLQYGIVPLIENYFGSADNCAEVLAWMHTAHPDMVYGVNILAQLQRSSTVIILHVMQLRFEKFRVGTTDFSERGADWRIECDSA